MDVQHKRLYYHHISYQNQRNKRSKGKFKNTSFGRGKRMVYNKSLKQRNLSTLWRLD